MFWGAIGGGKKLKFFDIDGNLNGTKYKSLLKKNCMKLIRRVGTTMNVIWMQDNAPSHRAKKVQNYFSRKKIKLLKWPPYSPDLNPIENLWGSIKRKIALRSPKTKNEIRKIAKQEWKRLSNSEVNELYLSMPRRIKAVLKKSWISDEILNRILS